MVRGNSRRALLPVQVALFPRRPSPAGASSTGYQASRVRLTGKPQPQKKSLNSQLMNDWKAWIERREREEDEKLQRFQVGSTRTILPKGLNRSGPAQVAPAGPARLRVPASAA